MGAVRQIRQITAMPHRLWWEWAWGLWAQARTEGQSGMEEVTSLSKLRK